MPIALGLGLALDLISDGAAPEPPCTEPPVVVSYPIAPSYTGNFNVDEVYFNIVATLCGEPIPADGSTIYNLYVAYPSDPTNFFWYTNSGDGVIYLGWAGSFIDGWRCKVEIVSPSGTTWTPEWTVTWTCSTPPNANLNYPNPRTVTNGSTIVISFSSFSCGGTVSEMQVHYPADPPGVWTLFAGPTFPDPGNGYIQTFVTASPAINGAEFRGKFTNPYGTTYTPIPQLFIVV